MRKLPRPRLRLVRTEDGFAWYSRGRWFDPEMGDPLYTIWCTRHDTRDEAIDYYNKILEDFNAESN